MMIPLALADEIVAYTHLGYTAQQIADQLGCLRSTVHYTRRRRGCTRPAGSNQAIDRQRVVELTRQGHTAAYIAEVMKCCKRTVHRIREAEHCQVSPPGRPFTEDEILLAKQWLNDGASYSEVAETLNRHVQVIADRFPNQGWTKEQTAQYNSLRKLRKKVGV